MPDSRTAASMIRTIHTQLPDVKIIARGRYHRHMALLKAAGASLVVDEEQMVGVRLAESTAEQLAETNFYAMACRMIGKKMHADQTAQGAFVPTDSPADAAPNP